MFVRLNSVSPVPIYRQILDQIRYQIAGRALRAGDRLPSVRELAKQLAANQNTILKVYDQLAAEGLIERKRGDGTFVAKPGPTLKRSERKKRLRETLSLAAVQAHLFEIDRPDVHDLLDSEMEEIDKDKSSSDTGKSS